MTGVLQQAGERTLHVGRDRPIRISSGHRIQHHEGKCSRPHGHNYEISVAADAFNHADGRPRFEPGLNASSDAGEGEVQIQKACRLLDVSKVLDDAGDYYGAILEQSFIVIEQTFQGYVIAVAGNDPVELRNHQSPYEFAKGQVPLEDATIESLQRLYDTRRTRHYYGTTVTTKTQAERMNAVATRIHSHIIFFDHDLQAFCRFSKSY